MLSRKPLILILAITSSVTLHALGFGISSGPKVVAVEGGAPKQVAMLGNSFADMAAGTLAPTFPTQESVSPVTPAEMPPVAPSPAQFTLVPPTPSAPTTPVISPAPTSTPTPTPTNAQTVVSSSTPTPKTLSPVEKPAPKPRPKPVKRVKSTPKPAPKAGGTVATKRGQSDGQAGAKATKSGRSTGTTRQAGNAAVSNYPGKVWRKLQRTRKRGRGRGKAIVGFKISASGGVGGAWIIRSSGNAGLDAAAIKHVHRAAPFPKPPKGAKRQYSYDYVGR